MRQVETPQSCCRFGIARADVTPPAGIYHRMWGAATHDRSEGVHRPLTATAMFFGSLDPVGEKPQLLVAIDHCLFGVAEVDSILDKAATRSGIDRDAISITFSHTHAAGLLNLDREAYPGGDLIPGYLEQLAATIGELSKTARELAAEATIAYAIGRCNLAAHRDYFDDELGQFVCGYNPGVTADDTLLVARVTNENDELVATIVNYACHPTTLAWDNRLISPDYPGAMREVIEQVCHVPSVFLQGASGDLGPVDGYVGDTEVADRNGRQLGFSALSILESMPQPRTRFEYAGPVVSGATIGTWQHVAVDENRKSQLATWARNAEAIPLAYREELPTVDEVTKNHARLLKEEQAARDTGEIEKALDLRALAEREKRMLGRLQGLPTGPTFPFHAAVWRIGDAIWIAAQGEPYSLLQTALRTRFPETPIVISTIANGWGPSYMPPRELYGTGIYQESIASLAPGSLETLIEKLAARIEDLLRP